ncbi:transglycosylase SLT domain-containing protein [Gluconacetobacter azotocaptans]|uniref:Transglycosylase SLT domain-containing protein n=1 Tax=Gluconacetobacter azotocaptans TaxID=142834 RepID=A0A7W4JR86_9PROT|nr:transglycosylase SLT domain-containing protein [Gluconacetobacter azotocaptans]MBB2189439.1 transglycosylase SLT domain-containing protein [Gluconacetobacter azotocaptans]GBQ34614.1 hypothetical protein AA13594_2914 [Gluconacetobacter azotocaptans DSM 13594]
MPVFPIRRPLCLALVAAILFPHVPAAAGRTPEAALCLAATAQAERALRIPDGFLAAMSRVESGKLEPDGVISAWPWTVNAAGAGYHYATREEAMAAVRMFRQEGITSIDVGCMQVNLQQHPDAFPSLEQAFDPVRNALYAGTFLLQMHDKTGSWPRAAAAYHSQTPGLGPSYQWKVLEEWAVPQDGRGARPFPRKGGQTAPSAVAQIFPHPVAPLTARHTPVMVAAAPGEDGKPAAGPARVFHPYEGDRHFAEAPTHKAVTSGVRGRTLASYRSAPVALAGSQRPMY